METLGPREAAHLPSITQQVHTSLPSPRAVPASGNRGLCKVESLLPSPQPRSRRGRCGPGCVGQARPGGAEAQPAECSVAGPRRAPEVGVFFPSMTSRRLLPSLIGQAQNGPLARAGGLAGRQARAGPNGSHMVGHRPDPGTGTGGRYFRPERKGPAHEMSHQGQIILRKTLGAEL